jgi:hypothetical protein
MSGKYRNIDDYKTDSPPDEETEDQDSDEAYEDFRELERLKKEKEDG